MGLDPSALPNAFLSRMAKADRAPLGKAGVTMQEIETKHAFRREKELQERCVAMLRLRNIVVNVSRMDKRKTDKTGWPDLTFSYPPNPKPETQNQKRHGIPCAIECKLPGCHPTPEQVKVMAQMLDNGWFVRVVTSEEQMLEVLKTLAAF